ncbi:SDR family oxidoreductase [Terasakiella sp. SH-1]|uniref:dTDP-4-dehydrorhamnose reductase family protein n=1 Tax=Terasakiella sp. SH-1 TaxID=2560057 RepID=UPI001073FA5A|nr:SDR family oxidoreductase [Terasakiella sp. SH-1]
MMKILLTGATGFLGGYLGPKLKTCGEIFNFGLSQAEENSNFFKCNLSDASQIEDLLPEINPDVILHTVAATNVDCCEEDPQSAYISNVQITRNLTSWILKESSKTRFIYISTDQVYSGIGPHSENIVAPINIYAMTKLWGEDLARQLPNHLIIRTNFFGLGREKRLTFVDWLIHSFLEKTKITLFDDIYFSPLYVEDLAKLIKATILSDRIGTYNLGSSCGGMSKADFALCIADYLMLDTSMVKIGKSIEKLGLAPRPKDMRMNSNRFSKDFKITLPSIHDGIKELSRKRKASQR